MVDFAAPSCLANPVGFCREEDGFAVIPLPADILSVAVLDEGVFPAEAFPD